MAIGDEYSTDAALDRGERGSRSRECATQTHSQKAILDLTRNMPSLPGICRDVSAPVIRNTVEGRTSLNAHWSL